MAELLSTYSKEFSLRRWWLGMVVGIERAWANRPAAVGLAFGVAVPSRAQTILAFRMLGSLCGVADVSGGARASAGCSIFLTVGTRADWGSTGVGYAKEASSLPKRSAHDPLEPQGCFFAPGRVVMGMGAIWVGIRQALFLISWDLAITLE